MTPLRSLIVGGAGFIGSHLVERLVERGPVTVYDDLSVGRRGFIEEHLASGRATLIQADALDLDRLAAAAAGHDAVFHLAANPEARWGLERTRLDLEQGTIATYNALEAARRAGVRRFVFSSSGTVYGETPRACAEGDLGALPISLYGASKLAGEAMISAFVECFGLRAWIYRFGNVVGPRGTHGAALDFLRKLRDTKTELEVLGDGRQSKPYLHVSDCVAGILFGFDHASEPLNIHNLAPPRRDQRRPHRRALRRRLPVQGRRDPLHRRRPRLARRRPALAHGPRQARRARLPRPPHQRRRRAPGRRGARRRGLRFIAFGGQVIYNPWSVLNFLNSEDKVLRPYWVATASDELIRELLLERGADVHEGIETLLRGEEIEETIVDSIILRDLDDSPEALWSFLLYSGYLKATAQRWEERRLYCRLAIPNEEVLSLYETVFRRWLEQSLGGSSRVRDLCRALLEGDAEGFEELVEELMINALSFHDTATGAPSRAPERVYQAFIVGLLVHLEGDYVVRSNRESGLGRYDVMISPRTPGKPGVIMELKVPRVRRGETVEQALDAALAQIEKRRYDVELRAAGAHPIRKVGVVFDGRRVHARFEQG